MFYVYVVRCRDGSLYTGYTDDVDKRVRRHNDGAGAKYTRSRRPVKLAGKWAYSSKPEAMRAEAAFKRLSRSDKLQRLNM